jgi:thiol-disulfide isomerase/thioredoxin
MSTFLKTHHACFRAEWQKMRHTALPWLCIGASVFLPLIQTLAAFFLSKGQQDGAWAHFTQDSVTGFAGFFYPLFLVILIGRIVYMEHKADTWKVLETQPVSRAALFLVKFEVAVLLAAVCLLLVLLFSLVGGLVLQTFKPSLGFSRSSIEWGVLGKGLLRLWIASMGLIALQYYLALLIKNFAGPMTIGVIAIIAAGILNEFGIWGWWPYNAISLTSKAFKGSPTGEALLYHEYLSVAWALLFLLLAYQLLRQRGFEAAHFRGRRGLATALGVTLFAVLVSQVSKPKVMDRYASTVITGTLKTTKPVTQVALVRPAFNDTVLVVPVQGGSFHMRIAEALETATYELHAGTQQVAIFFGSRDSLHVDLTALKEDYKLQFSGTRAAESEFMQHNARPDFSFANRFASASESTPEKFADDVISQIDGEYKSATRYHTPDNIGMAPDFLAYYRKMLEVEALRQLEIEYPKTYVMYHPNATLKYPASVDSLRHSISFSDAALINLPGYLEYTADYIRAKSGRSSNRDSAFAALSSGLLKNDALREAIFLRFARERLRMLPDTSARQQFVQAAFTRISNVGYRQRLQGDLAQLNSLMRGRPAPDFAASATGGTAFTLSQFRGRYVVLDVWATWCGPCRRESPLFEEMAERYTGERLLFAAVSVDEDRNAWKREALFKSERVLQLHIDNALESFLKPYAIEGIPRFILIDPSGRIVNAAMPPPSEPEFAAILLRETGNNRLY